eukprot:218531_1
MTTRIVCSRVADRIRKANFLRDEKCTRAKLIQHIRTDVFGGKSHADIDDRRRSGLRYIKEKLKADEVMTWYPRDIERERFGGELERSRRAWYYVRKHARKREAGKFQTFKERHRDKRPTRKDFEWRYGWY